MAKKPDESKELRIIKSLEYCTIERAASLLGVEVEDIEHYLSIGSINCCIYMSGQVCQSQLVLGPNMLERVWPYSNGVDTEDIDELIGTELSFTSVVEAAIHRESQVISAHLYGIWKINFISDVEDILQNNIVNSGVVLRSVTRESLLNRFEPMIIDKDTAFICGFTLTDVNKENLRILSRDVIRLYDFLNNGNGTLINIHNNDELRKETIAENQAKSVHGNTIVNSQKRQEVLEFAIYVKNKWPEQCENCTAWASLVDEKAHLKWRDTGAPPLGNSTITDMLRDATRDFKE